MRKRLGTIAILAALAAVSGIPISAESTPARDSKDFLIRWNLFEGTTAKDAEPSKIILSTRPNIPTVRQLSNAAREPVRDLSGIQKELASIYKLESVVPLITNEWAWSRKNEKALNAILLQGEVMPITFTPRKASANQVNLRVQISRNPSSGTAAAAGASSDIVDMEFRAKYKESMVLGFESGDRSYFLAFEVLRGDAPESEPGPGALINEIDFLPASRPLVQTLPAYPPACKAAGIGGTVVLRVDAGADGTVTKVEILKSIHPDLDHAACEAVLGWKYEPVLKDGKPVPVSFSLSISFNPERKSGRKENPETEAPLLRPSATLHPPAPAGPSKILDPKLAEILDKAAAYCDKLRRASLDFVCREQVKEWVTAQKILGSTIVKRTDLLYDYQLVKDKDAITERRTLLEENGVKKEEKNAPLKTQRFYSVKAVFGPVGFMSREWRDLYDFRLLRDDKVDGRKAFVIEAIPKTKIEGKPNFGKIWVDQADHSILRIDIEQESLPGFEALAEHARASKFKPAFTISHIYGLEKNGLRFPSRTEFKEIYRRLFSPTGMNFMTLSGTTIIYADYKFFTVITDVVYKQP